MSVRSEAIEIAASVPEKDKPELAAVILIEVLCSVLSMLAQCYSTFGKTAAEAATAEFSPENQSYSQRSRRRTSRCFQTALRQHQAYMNDDEIATYTTATLDHCRTVPNDRVEACLVECGVS